jgi:transposase
MLSQDTLQRMQQVDFDRLARQEANGRRRLRLIALAHLKEGKNCTEVAHALRVTRHTVMRWVQWFSSGGMQRLAGLPHDWSTQRLPQAQEEAFRQAVEQLQRQRGGGRVRGEDIRQLLQQQFATAYSLNGVYHLLKRLNMTWVCARAVSPQANPVAQAAFKKKLRPPGASRSAARRSA